MTRAQGMALVALFAVFTVVGMNVLYLPVHVISEHHGLEAASVHDHESCHHDGASQDKHPEHDDADHDLHEVPAGQQSADRVHAGSGKLQSVDAVGQGLSDALPQCV